MRYLQTWTGFAEKASRADCSAGDCGIGAPIAGQADPSYAAGAPDRLAHLRKSELGQLPPIGQAGVAISPDWAARLT